MRWISKPVLLAVAAVCVASGVGLFVLNEERRPKILEIYIFSLSNSRSMLVRTPEDRRILINGGANGEVTREISRILPFYSKRIDALVATTIEDKDVGGLVEVLERYDVSFAYLPSITSTSIGLASSTGGAYSAFVDTVKRRGVATKEVHLGDTIGPLQIIFPAEPSEFSYTKASHPELLFKIESGMSSAVFLGDVTPKVQKFLIASDKLTSGGVAIFSGGASRLAVAKELPSVLKPSYIIYSRKKESKDMFDLDEAHRYNTKEKGTVKVAFLPSGLVVEPLD